MKAEFSNLARQEVKDVYEYYFTKVSKETADRFETEIQNSVNYLVKFYEANPLIKDVKRNPRNKDRRFVIMDVFPQHIFYSVNVQNNTINIDRVIHSSRDILSLLKE